MSNKERRAANEAEWQRQYDARQAEEARKEALDMFMRIEEAEASADVKDILHRIAAHLGMEK